MGFILLWIESLAAALLLTATAASVLAHIKRGWRRSLLMGLVLAVPLTIGILQTIFSFFLQQSLIVNHWLTFTLSWTIALLVGIRLILWRGMKETDGVAAAARWPSAHLAIGLVAALSLHLITFWNLDANMRLRLSSVRMEAGALALAAAPPRIPDAENAAFIYEKCFENDARILKTVKNSDSKVTPWFTKFNSPDYNTADPELRDYLGQLQPTLALVRRAAAMSGCYFEHEYAQPSIDMMLPELSRMRQLARILAVDARVKAADGKYREAFENISAMYKLCQHITTEPILVSGLVAVAIEHMADDTLEGILARGTPATADFAAWKTDDSFSFRRALRRCMAGEEAMGMSAFAMLGGDAETALFLRYQGINPDTTAPFVGPYWRVYLLADDLSEYRSQMKILREMSEQDFQTAHERLDALEKQRMVKRMGLVSHLLLPALSRSYISFVRGEVRHRLADMAVAVAAYRAKNGKYPSQAQDLVPDFISEVPIDPYDNKPLRLVSTASGVTLYSIGEDMKDDSGKVNNFETGDVLFNIGAAPGPARKAGSF